LVTTRRFFRSAGIGFFAFPKWDLTAEVCAKLSSLAVFRVEAGDHGVGLDRA